MKFISYSIDLQNVSFRYSKDFFVFRNLNLQIKQGETIGIWGPSGCGKSTLFKILTKKVQIISGSNVISTKVFEIPQELSLNPFLTIIETIYLAKTNMWDFTAINTLLSQLNLEGVKDTLINNLSTGERQRTAVACAIASDSLIILADEPFSNLSVEKSTQILDLVLKITKQRKITFILATHNRKHLRILGRNFEIKNLMLAEI